MVVTHFVESSTIVLLTLSLLSLLVACLYLTALLQSIRRAPRLRMPANGSEASLPETLPSLTVVVPAYNEAENVEDCLQAILQSSLLPARQFEVLLVDDQSEDETWAIAQSLQQRLKDPRLHLIAGQPRPLGERWVGKNWACVQAVERAQGEYVLFLDADVRLLPGAIATALQAAHQHQSDLLSCCLRLSCGCLAEWLVQPLIFGVILTGYRFDAVNDPASDVAFAGGPFMLFRRSAYDRIGGHRGVRDQVVEDVELAKRIKAAGLKLWVVIGEELGTLRMYRSWAALWEGWTKNLYLGCDRNFGGMVKFVILISILCVLPWGLAIALLLKYVLVGWSLGEGVAFACSLATLALHFTWRYLTGFLCGGSSRYWWLTPVGGVLVIALAIGSIIKTETGWGWTWRGRSLTVE